MQTTQAGRPANIINHVICKIDASTSMDHLTHAVVKVFDGFVAHLAEQSQVNGQETRITVYLFGSYGSQQCIIWDKDVLRMPSLEGLYRPYGNTALIQTTLLATREAREIPVRHGDHSFLFVGWTDGQENDSTRPRGYEAQRQIIAELRQTIESAPENETYALFVPDQVAVHTAKQYGYPAGNISVWDASSAHGVEEAGLVMRNVASAYMAGRAQGVRGYSARSAGSSGGLFRMRDFKAADVQASLTPVTPGSFFFLDVTQANRDPGSDGARLDRFYEGETGHPYPKGRCYYEFTKAEKVQGYKQVAIEVDGTLYSGTLDETRGLLGLPSDHEVKLRPDQKPGATIFIQSTSNNRKLMPGTRLLVMR
jgi:hypothetical protein